MPTLSDFIIGDLGPARRHTQRLLDGQLQAVPGVLDEIAASLERCVARIEKHRAEIDAVHELKKNIGILNDKKD